MAVSLSNIRLNSQVTILPQCCLALKGILENILSTALLVCPKQKTMNLVCFSSRKSKFICLHHGLLTFNRPKGPTKERWKRSEPDWTVGCVARSACSVPTKAWVAASSHVQVTCTNRATTLMFALS